MVPPLPRGNIGILGPGWADPLLQHSEKNTDNAPAKPTETIDCGSCYTPNHTLAQFQVDVFKNAERVKKISNHCLL